MAELMYFENMHSMNVFYTLVMKIRETCERKKNCFWFGHQFEVSIKVGESNVKPDAIVKYKFQRMPSNVVLALEYKDCQSAEHVIKIGQITKYENLNGAYMRESGLEILKNSDFGGLSLIYRNNGKNPNLAHNIQLRYEGISNNLNFPFGIYEISELADGSLLKLEKATGASFAIIDLVGSKPFLYKELCVFDFKLEMRKKVNDIEELPGNVKNNLSVLLSLIIGYGLRLSWKGDSFTIVDAIKFSSPTTWEIMKKIKNVHRVLRLFDNITKRLLVKNKYLMVVGEAEVKLEDMNIRIEQYKFNSSKNLMHKKTIKSLYRLIEKHFKGKIFEERLINEMPLFKWRQEDMK